MRRRTKEQRAQAAGRYMVDVGISADAFPDDVPSSSLVFNGTVEAAGSCDERGAWVTMALVCVMSVGEKGIEGPPEGRRKKMSGALRALADICHERSDS
jgi:hypothetical protein